MIQPLPVQPPAEFPPEPPPARVSMTLSAQEADLIKAMRGIQHQSIFMVRVGGDGKAKRMLVLQTKGMQHFFEAMEQVLT